MLSTMMPSLFSEENEPRELAIAKRKMRDAMLAARRAIPHAAIANASDSVARHYADHPILAFCASIAGYRAIRGEMDIMPIFQTAMRYQRETYLPRVVEKNTPLAFHQWGVGMPLTRHPLGMEEPHSENAQATPDIVLVPLLAFDGDGYRLGYGAGFYDRTMAALREAEEIPPLFIGVGYNSQEVERVPTGTHDQPLDGVITEHGVSMFNLMHPRILV